MKDSRLQPMARRGITLPQKPESRFERQGSRCGCGPIVTKQRAMNGKLRGEDQVARWWTLVTMLGFVGKDGETTALASSELQNFLPNGVHAVVVEAGTDSSGCLLRANLRPADHVSLTGGCGAKGAPYYESNSVLGRDGTLETDSGVKTQCFVVVRCPYFFTRSGEQGLPDTPRIEATLKVTEVVCCTGCCHCHPRRGTKEAPLKGASMIDWHHPRIYERSVAPGWCLSTSGTPHTTSAIGRRR